MIGRRLLSILACLGAIFGGTAASSADALRITSVADRDATGTTPAVAVLADRLSSALGVDVEYVPEASYDAAVEAFRNGNVDLAWFGGLTGIKAREAVAGAEAIAQGAEDRDSAFYLIAYRGTDIQRSADLPTLISSKSFTFGAEESISGHVMPDFYIRQNFQRPPEEVFDRVHFSGSHARTIELVGIGEFQIGAVSSAFWDTLSATEPDKLGNASVIWASPPFPDQNWTVRPGLDERFGDGFTSRLQQAIIGLDDAQLLSMLKRTGFVPASNADYDSLRKAAVDIGLLEK